MDLFKHFKINTECVLCGCEVDNFQSNQLPNSSKKFFSNSPLICAFCHRKMPLTESSCFTCGLPLVGQSNPTEAKQPIGRNCGNCLVDSPNYDRTISAFHYEYPVSNFISQLKYSAQLQYLPLLASYLCNAVETSYQTNQLPELVIPVPLHSKKLAQRGFNQSRLLANKLAKHLSIKVLKKGVERIKPTQAQSGLDSNERKNNVKGAFQVNAALPLHVAVIDDVVTTGMTVTELTKQLKLAGVLKVDIWCLARAFEL